MEDQDETFRIYAASEPPSTSKADVGNLEHAQIEKEPLIDDGSTRIDEQAQSYWKGCELLKASNLYTSKLSLQSSSSSSMCRICHTTTTTRSNPLISPCRCSGSLIYVHKACVVRWLEMSTRKMVPAPRCEICGYDFKRDNVFQIRSIHFPHVDRDSCVLNILFITTLIIMIFCGYFTIRFIQENAIMKRRAYSIASSQATHTWKRRGYFSGGPTGELESSSSNSDGMFSSRPHVSSLFDYKVVSCALLFLLAFFVSLFTQYRAESTVFRCIFRFFVINQNWMIKSYDIKDDPEMAMRRDVRAPPLPVCSIPHVHQPSGLSLILNDPIVLTPSSVSNVCLNSNRIK